MLGRLSNQQTTILVSLFLYVCIFLCLFVSFVSLPLVFLTHISLFHCFFRCVNFVCFCRCGLFSQFFSFFLFYVNIFVCVSFTISLCLFLFLVSFLVCFSCLQLFFAVFLYTRLSPVFVSVSACIFILAIYSSVSFF